MDLAKHDASFEASFAPEEEAALVSLILDFPEFFANLSDHITPDLFAIPEVKFVMAFILNAYDKFNVVPTRELMSATIKKQLKVDDNYEGIVKLLSRPSDPREVPLLKDSLMSWAERKTYGKLYEAEVMSAVQNGNYAPVKEIVDKAGRISDVATSGFWLFKHFETLFQEQSLKHIKTGFAVLDSYLNEGGPSPGEVLVWMAATGVGKSIMLCNNARACHANGENVLYITFELSTYKTAMRIIGSATHTDMRGIRDNQDKVRADLNEISRAHDNDIVLYELPPGECSVNNIYAIIDSLKKQHGWKPTVIILDYLELMVSRHAHNNKDGDYTAQKHVATEIRGLARNEDVVIFTATQGNRSSTDQKDNCEYIDLSKMAESYGKAMPMDYVISINQTDDERNKQPAECRFYIAKNRNGDKFKSITACINYKTMRAGERP